MAQLVHRMGCHEGCPEHGVIFCHSRVADGGDVDVFLAQGSSYDIRMVDESQIIIGCQHQKLFAITGNVG